MNTATTTSKCPEAGTGEHLWLEGQDGPFTCYHCRADHVEEPAVGPAPTAAQSLDRADKTLLRRLAFEVQGLARCKAQLAGATTPDFIAPYAQRVAEAAMKVELLRELVVSTGVTVRHTDLTVAAFEGDDSNLY